VSEPGVMPVIPEAAGTGDAQVDPLYDPLAEVCRTLAGFDGPGDPSWVDGYLVAIAASRRHIGTEEWLPRLGGEAFERAYADPPAAAQATLALERWLARRREELEPQRLVDRGDEVFLTPLFDEWTDDDRRRVLDEGDISPGDAATLHSGCLWAEGFQAAVADFADDWPEPDTRVDAAQADAYRAMRQLVGCLSLDPDGDACRTFFASQWSGPPPTREELLDEVCFAVQDLRVWWLDHPARPQPRHVPPAPGRNDPCPCGSGLKYKKCHGAAG